MRTRGRRWPVVVLLVLALVAALLLVAQDEFVLRVGSPVDAAAPRFPDYVASLVGAPVTSGDQYRMLLNGDEIFPAMLDAVQHARRRINFESFIYSDGAMSVRFTEALVAAAARGITVRLVLDAFGSADLPADAAARLQRAGVQLRWFRPLRSWTILEQANYRTHRKALIVDGAVAFTGGVGVADHWLGHAQDAVHWRDTQFEVIGPAVRAIESCFYENWLESGGAEAPPLDPEDAPQGTGARSIVSWSSASEGAGDVKLLYILSVAGARHTLDIQSPYLILDRSTEWALQQARARGVRVRVLTEGDRTDAQSVKDASRAAYQDLLDRGFAIYEYAPTMMHVKAMVVDGTWSVFGSANFDNRSLELNDEMTVAVSDRGLASAITGAFENDLRHATRLGADTWRQRSLVRKARERFWSLFGELF